MTAAPPRRLIGLDVGERRIGVAVSEGRIAVPLTIVHHTNRAADIHRVSALVAEREADAVVVGLPLTDSGEEREQARLTRRFGEQLAAALAVPVVFHDESFSTAAVATAAVADAPRLAEKKRGKEYIDDLAATVILQSYIDAQECADAQGHA